MKKRTLLPPLFLLSTFIALTSCLPSDPYTLQAAGNQALEAAHAQMTSTAEAAIQREDEAILQQAQTQAANDNAATATANVVYLNATATALFLEAQATQQAATAQAIGTQEAQVALATRQAVELAQLQAGATATQQAALNLAEAEAAQLVREKVVTVLMWGAAFITLILALFLAFEFVRVFTRAFEKQRAWVPGAETLVFDTPAGPIIVDPRRMFGPTTVIANKTQHVTMPVLTEAHFQAMTTQAALLVELAKAMIGGFHPPYPAGGNLPQMLAQAQPPALLSTGELPPHAPWRLLDEWRGEGLPLGLENGGLLLADPESSPHLLLAGTSGSGKTRYGLRPVIAGALAAGWQVAIFDRSGLDFLPFQEHPNAHLYPLANAEEAIGYEKSLYEAIVRRFQILRTNGVSTWGQLKPAPEPRLLIVFDEFANLADSLENKGREELWRYARMIAAEGRKAGIHLALALQDPTHKSLDLRIRRNCTPIAFRVRDDDASRVILGAGGAETLPPRQFM
ncbi:MAG TPA: hypothetical protein PK530_09015, partial [Anaerolineales bacterium]|nr:hypothetical protein [Anaerolineales bacterium]